MTMRNLHHFKFDFDKNALKEECFNISGWDKYEDPRAGTNYSDNDTPVSNQVKSDKPRKENPFEVVRVKDIGGEVIDGFEIAKRELQKFLQYYDIENSHHVCVYHRLLKDRILMPHRDYKVQCAVNVLLDDTGSEVQFIDDIGIEKSRYECAVLNVSEVHSVKNRDKHRHLFKIAFVDLSYNDIVNIINNRRG